MVTSKNVVKPICKLESKGDIIKQVDSFKYLGYCLNTDGKCVSEVKKRISLAKDAFYQMKAIMRNKHISMNTKMKVLKTYIWGILLYGCESWTINKEIERRLEATEMWFIRRMLRISWIDRVTNEDVLKKAGINRSLMTIIRKRQLSFLGHVYRKDNIERVALTGRIEGKRSRGRQRKTYMQSLKERTTKEVMSTTNFLRMAERKDDWRHMITKSCGEGT